MDETAARALAERVAASMYARDTATQALGIRVVRVEPGYAELAMVVRNDMLNGHEICHGGFIFTLADSAFAFACNSYNELTVASGFAVDPRPARVHVGADAQTLDGSGRRPGHRWVPARDGPSLTRTCASAGRRRC